MGIDYNFSATLLNYLNLYLGGGTQPTANYDYYEPRLPGRFVKSWQVYYTYVGINTDARKKLWGNIQVTSGNFYKHNSQNMPNPPGGGFQFNLTYRTTDRLSFGYVFDIFADPWNLGFADIQDTDVYFGARFLRNYTNILSAKYIFQADMSISLRVRHYWSAGEYKQYYYLQQDGYLKPIDDHHVNNDFSYNAFTVDLLYSWQFAPGSILSVVYKNAIEKDEQLIIRDFKGNFKETINSPQLNGLSVKLVYYIDYLQLKRRKG
jgi:hypothetical protein